MTALSPSQGEPTRVTVELRSYTLTNCVRVKATLVGFSQGRYGSQAVATADFPPGTEPRDREELISMALECMTRWAYTQ